jgi:hypothetical protein
MDFDCRQCDVYVAVIDAHADVVEDGPPPEVLRQLLIAYHGSGHRDPLS